jgi:hypothetical protein
MTHGAMHNPGHPVEGASGGEVPPHQGLPQHCPSTCRAGGCYGQQINQGMSRANPPSSWAEIPGHLQLHPHPYMVSPLPQGQLRMAVTLPQLYTQTILWYRRPESGMHTPTRAREARLTPPDLHVHLRLRLTTLSSRTASQDPKAFQ